MAYGKKLADIKLKDCNKIGILLNTLKKSIKLILSNEIDTKIETSVIKESEEAKATEKLMYCINTIN